MKRSFLASWPKPGRWRVGANGLYYPVGRVKPIKLRQLPGGRLELA